MNVRSRRTTDLEPLLVLLAHVQQTEGYPVRAAAVSAEWLTSSDKPGRPRQPELSGWVAEQDERVLGHVGLHPAGGPCLPLWTAAAGCAEDGLAVVSRLFTDRSVRGTGTALLDHAVTQAHGLGRLPVLEVDGESPALGWYLRRGWVEVGRADQQWGHRLVDTAALVWPGDGQQLRR